MNKKQKTMLARILAAAAIGGAALDDGAIEQMDQIADELGMQIVVSAGFAGGDLDAHFTLQFHTQCLVDPNQAFRCDFFCKIHFGFFHD